MLVSCVHPVAILRAVFCTICSLSMFVSNALGDHMVKAYSSMGLVMALYNTKHNNQRASDPAFKLLK